MEHIYRPVRPRKMNKLCGFTCLRWALVLLNIFYIILGLILIGLAIASKSLALFSEPHVLIGIAVSGAVLTVIAILGLIGGLRHHQVILFFYMIVLGVSVVFMFSVSVAALATTQSLQERFLLNTWIRLSNHNKIALQDSLNCCGFNNESQNNSVIYYHPSCRTKPLQTLGGCCSNDNTSDYQGHDVECPHCKPCYNAWKVAVDRAVRLSGGFGLVFSFTQIIGIVLTFRYRNEKDPSVNPRTIL